MEHRATGPEHDRMRLTSAGSMKADIVTFGRLSSNHGLAVLYTVLRQRCT